ncbi:MAG: TrpB-like pyridoxal phosphate-dependent enzyme, partial [Rhodoplanes sp.]
MTDSVKYLLPEDRIPRAWYNIAADLPKPLPAVLHPGTGQPIGPADLAAIFPMPLILQEVARERDIEIPQPVRDVYKLWRPAPLYRALRLERALDTPARIFYKYEGVSPAGSHKPNTAVAQAFYNRESGIAKLSTETGAGQWGSSLAFAGALFGLEVKVYMVRVSYQQKPYRRALMETYGATCIPSPSKETESGRAILAANPDSPGSLGIAISEAVEVAAKNADTNYALGSVLNHVLLHQTVIGLEAIEQMEMAGFWPDVVIACAGGGSNFAGIAFPFLGKKLRGGKDVRVVAVEPAACPTLTRGTYAYDFGDTAHLTPLVKMHTLGSQFVPPGFHAGGLRYHGMAPLVSHLKELGLIEARAVHQTPCFEAGVAFARAEGIVPAPEATHAVARRDRRGARGQGGGARAHHLVQPVRPRPFRHAGLYRLFRRQAGRPRL